MGGGVTMRARAIFGILMLSLVHDVTARAASAASSCVPDSKLISAEQAAQFLDSPAALLDQFKDGQGGLASEIRDLVSARPETIEGIVSLVKASSGDQSRAIGAGLGAAATVCVLTQPAVAQQIQEVVLKTESAALIQAFVSITGDIPTQAIDGGDPNGDETPGGGRGKRPIEQAGGAVNTTTPTLEFGGAPPARTTIFNAASFAGAGPISSVSPSRR